MLVAFWDQLFGNSTPRCSKAGLSGIADHGVPDLPLDLVEGMRPGESRSGALSRGPGGRFGSCWWRSGTSNLLLSRRLWGVTDAGSSSSRTEPVVDATPQKPRISRSRSPSMVTRRWCGRGRPRKPESAKEVASDAIAAVKPKLRGVSHEWAFFVSLGLGAALILAAKTPKATLAVAIYAVSLSALLGTSALYHRVNWKPAQRAPLDAPARPLDDLLPDRRHLHAVRAAGPRRPARRRDPRRRLGRRDRRRDRRDGLDRPPEMGRGAVYISLGWVAVVAFPALWTRWASPGRCWSPPAACSTPSAPSSTRPSGRTRTRAVFGYHEVFHLLVIAAAAAHFAAIAFFALPAS